MRNENYRKRIIDNILDIYLKTFGAVLIEGPKWCGKTWTSKYHSNSEFLLSDPKGNFNNKKLAMINPDLALRLFLLSSQRRFLNGKQQYFAPSDFLLETNIFN